MKFTINLELDEANGILKIEFPIDLLASIKRVLSEEKQPYRYIVPQTTGGVFYESSPVVPYYTYFTGSISES